MLAGIPVMPAVSRVKLALWLAAEGLLGAVDAENLHDQVFGGQDVVCVDRWWAGANPGAQKPPAGNNPWWA
jgi:hypothetical protein